MVSNLEELGDLLKENNLTPADIEYIVNFMNKEKISPQLAMRRIKAFDTLKAKLDNNENQEKIELLEQELQEIKNQLLEKNKVIKNMQQEKSGLESEKEELESKSELIDSEREELQRQLEMIRDMQFPDEEEDETGKIEVAVLQELQKEMRKLEDDKDLNKVIKPLSNAIQQIIDEQKFQLDIEGYKNDLRNITTSKPSTIKQQTTNTSEPKSTTSQPETKPTSTKTKEEQKPDKKKEEPKKGVNEKEEQVLNLFLEFIEEAETDKGFQERVSTICDMDEAYQYLGSIGLSQVYSFASRGMDKKKELQELLNSWKNEGIPR